MGGAPRRSRGLGGPGLGRERAWQVRLRWMDQEGSSGGREGASREVGGEAVLRWGLWAQLPCGGGGPGPVQVGKDEGNPRPASSSASGGRARGGEGTAHGPPVLLALGDERLSLPRLWVGAWVTEAALYPLRAGAVARRRGEDVVGARGRGLLGPHREALVRVLVVLLLLGQPPRISAQPQDLALQLLVHQVHGLRRLRGGRVDGDHRQVSLGLIGQRVCEPRARCKLASTPEPSQCVAHLCPQRACL